MNAAEMLQFSGNSASHAEVFERFAGWFKDAKACEQGNPDTMALATVDKDGFPDVRIVLLKAHDERGFVFFTHVDSSKGVALTTVPRAAIAFYWKSLGRQVRVRGPVEQVTDAEADAYFATRPRASQISAWASRQSRGLESRDALEARLADVDARYPAVDVPRPQHWSGFRIIPLQIEYWVNGPAKLHDRTLFTRATVNGRWMRTLLYP